jgi:hypothetical protein
MARYGAVKSSLKWLSLIFILLKIKWLLTALIWNEVPPPPIVDNFIVNYDQYLMANKSDNNFQVMDRPSVQFLQLPKISCSEKQQPTFAVMVLSAPKNVLERQRIRDELKSQTGK